MSHVSSATLRVRRRPVASVALLSLAVLSTMVWAAPPAPAVGTCTPAEMPEVFPVADLEKGMTGTGQTVIDGTTQTSFDVEILGVDPGGIAPGVAFILAQITGPADFIEETGGIVAGMSGSPVYIDGKLVGSTSYGFFASDQTIMGITPAEKMVEVFGYPAAASESQAASRDERIRAVAGAKEVRLSDHLRRAAAKAAGAEASEFPAQAKQLRVPLAISGLDARGMKVLRTFIRRSNLPVRAYATTGNAGGAASQPLTGGDALAAALSYGDITAAGIGTATATCGNLVLGFGHPFFWSGSANFGMNGAEILKVIKDPSSLFGGFKFGVVAGLHGTVDQDRLTAIRGMEGVTPPIVPIVVDMTNPDLNRSRTGGSEVVTEEFIPVVTAETLLVNQDVMFDRIGDGSVVLDWIVRGVGPGGERFNLSRDNMYFSGFDASFESIFEVYGQLLGIQDNRFGPVEFSRIHLIGEITEDQLTTTVQKVLSASTSSPGLRERQRLVARAGDTIRLRVLLQDFGEDRTRAVNMRFEVPRRARGFGTIQVRPGQQRFCGFGSCPGSSFQDLLQRLENGEHNYDLVGEMRIGTGGGRGEPVELGSEGGPEPSNGARLFRAKVVAPQDAVVLRGKFLRLRVLAPRG